MIYNRHVINNWYSPFEVGGSFPYLSSFQKHQILLISFHLLQNKLNIYTLNKVPGNSVVLPPTAILTPSGPTAIKVKSSYWIFQDTIGTSFDLNSQEYCDNPHYCVNRVTTGYKSGRHLWLTALK